MMKQKILKQPGVKRAPTPASAFLQGFGCPVFVCSNTRCLNEKKRKKPPAFDLFKNKCIKIKKAIKFYFKNFGEEVFKQALQDAVVGWRGRKNKMK